MPKILLLIVLSLGTLYTSGCVTGRRTVSLAVPMSAPSPATKGDAHVASVVDKRIFENKPRDPSTPSIDGDVTALSEKDRSTFIGRQRNTYGKALGDIALPPGETVSNRVQALVEEGLRRRGYNVVGQPSASGASLNITISEFWAWATPGMWSMPFEAKVGCTITWKKGSETKTLKVAGYGRNQVQIASDENWQLAYSRAFINFTDNLLKEMNDAGL